MKLSDWLDEKKEPRATFARRVGVHPITVTKWCSGIWIPRADALDRIHAATDGAVTANDFLAAVLERRREADAAEAA